MFEVICGLIVISCAIGSVAAYAVTRDALHPAVFVSPLFGYFYGVWPIILNADGELQALIDASYLTHAAILFLAAILAMFAGLLWRARANTEAMAMVGGGRGFLVPPERAGRLFMLAVVLGLIAIVAYIIQLDNVGGFWRAYSRAKGGGRSDSGYIGEGILLSFPAILFLALAVRASGGRIRLMHIVIATAVAMPHLLQGILGGRRGPLFIILSTLLFAWFIARGRRPSFTAMVASVAFLGLTMVVVKSQRHHIYIGSDGQFEFSRIFDADGLSLGQPGSRNSYFTGVAQVLAADFYGDYYWGYRYLVTFFVRPIPKQLWSDKYADVGASWIEQNRNDRETGHYFSVVNEYLPRGVSGGAIADGYQEFWWGVVVMFFLIGRLFAYVYWKHRRSGGFWTVLLMLMLALGVYLPSQSFSAWLHRLMFMSFFTLVFWRLFVGRLSMSERNAIPTPPSSAYVQG